MQETTSQEGSAEIEGPPHGLHSLFPVATVEIQLKINTPKDPFVWMLTLPSSLRKGGSGKL